MSLNLSAEVEARIVAKAKEAGLPINDFLELVVSQNEEFSASLNKVEAATEPLSSEETRARLERGLAQLEGGEFVDGEQFMAHLLSGIDVAES